jgi:alpha-L-rhamnosidase
LSVASQQPRFGWLLTARDPNARGLRQTAYRVLVSSSTKSLARDAGDLWDSGRVDSGQTLDIVYAGKPLEAGSRIFWKVRAWDQSGTATAWSTPTSFTLAMAGWTARWIAAAPEASEEAGAEGVTRPMPVFRRAFTIDKPVSRAMLRISGLGQYEAHINGTRVSRSELAPGWTDYRKRVLYDTYDVTSMLRTGSNALGVLLGNGMFNVVRTPGRYTKFVGTFGEPRCIVELHLFYRDGSDATVATDSDWQTADGPIIYSSTFGGEDYDARKVPVSWDTPGAVDASAWRAATIVPGPGGELDPETIPPIEAAHVYHPVARRLLASGALIYDLGQNLAGWPQITVRGEAGAQIKLICGELLDSDGAVSQRSANAGPDKAQWFTYILSGHGVERWHPRFSYYGFRYVQVEITGQARVISLAGDATHSSAEPTGEFTSSIPLLDRIHTLILRAIENNMQSVLTDCPHREKLGWLEESHLMGSAMNFDFDLERLYGKIESDMADEQKPDGSVPTIAPQYVVFPKPANDVFNDSPEWGSAAVLDPWIAYRRYGDLEALRTAYPEMRRYVEYLTSRSDGGIVDYGLGDWYDIGPKAPGFAQLTSRALTATSVYYQDIIALASAAQALGDTEEEKRLEDLRDSVARAFNQRFYVPEKHEYDRGSQTADAMALTLGLVPEVDRAAVLQSLIADIRAHNNHVTAGDVGFHYVVDALTENGASDILLDMLLRTDSPSYGYQLTQGATALAEAWDARPNNSQDHLMLGHAEEWFYAGLGGIHVDFSRKDPERIVIRPVVLDRLASVDVLYRSVLGPVGVAWRHGAATTVDVTVPVNATATVAIPAAKEGHVRESGGQASHALGVAFVKIEDGSAIFRVESGVYHFSITAQAHP